MSKLGGMTILWQVLSQRNWNDNSQLASVDTIDEEGCEVFGGTCVP